MHLVRLVEGMSEPEFRALTVAWLEAHREYACAISTNDGKESISFEDRPKTLKVQKVLTHRQTEVMDCLLHAWPNKVIARRLNISENTLKKHLAAIYSALGVSSRSEAIIAFQLLTKDAQRVFESSLRG